MNCERGHFKNTQVFFMISFMAITIQCSKIYSSKNLIHLNSVKFKFLRAVQFLSTMYEKFCKTNVSRTFYLLSSVHDSIVEWEEKEVIHEKIERCVIWVVIDILLWQVVDSAYPFLKFAVIAILSFFVFSAR